MKLKKLSKDKTGLIENFLSLSVLQGVNMILPFITLPYLVRVLEVDNFGLVNFSVAIIGYFNILVSFGFELSATKKISLNRDDTEKMSEIFSAVTCVKTVLLLVSFTVLSFLIFYIDSLYEYAILYYVTFGIVLGNVLFPTWFFQGVEKMKYITIITVIIRVLFTIFIFTLVKDKNDFIVVPMLNSIGAIVGGIVSLYIIRKTYGIKFYFPKYEVIKGQVRESYYYFISRISNNGSRYLATTIIGAYFGNTMVGYYTLVEKLFYAFTTIGGLVSQTIYPYMSRTKDLGLLKKILWRTVLVAITCTLLLMYFNEPFLRLIFDVESAIVSTNFLMIFSSAVFSIVSSIIGYPLLAAFGFPKHANNSLIYSSLIYLVYIVLAVFLTENIFYVSFSMVVYTMSGFLFRIYYIKKEGIFETNMGI